MPRQRDAVTILADHETAIRQMRATLARIGSGPAVSALGDLSDVTENAVTNDEVLQYTGAGWENQTLAEAGISAVGHGHVEADISDLQAYALAADLADYLPLAGGTMSGDIDLDGNDLLNAVVPDYLPLAGGILTGNLFTGKIQTGQSSFTQEPWSSQTIALGDFGSVGTQGSYRTSLAWNWERGTDSGYYNLGVNSYTNMGAVEIGNDGIRFEFENNASPTQPPAMIATINASGLDMNGNEINMGGSSFIRAQGFGTDPYIAINSTYIGVHNSSWGLVIYNNRTEVRQDFQPSSMHFYGDTDTGIKPSGANALLIEAGAVSKALFGSDTRIYGINDTTTGAGANIFINSVTSLMARSTSSLRYKKGWEFVDEAELADLELPRPITWHDKMAGEMLGFGTEHIQSMLPSAVQDFDEDGRPENYDVRSLVAILTAKVRRLEGQLALTT